MRVQSRAQLYKVWWRTLSPLFAHAVHHVWLCLTNMFDQRSLHVPDDPRRSQNAQSARTKEQRQMKKSKAAVWSGGALSAAILVTMMGAREPAASAQTTKQPPLTSAQLTRLERLQ